MLRASELTVRLSQISSILVDRCDAVINLAAFTVERYTAAPSPRTAPPLPRFPCRDHSTRILDREPGLDLVLASLCMNRKTLCRSARIVSPLRRHICRARTVAYLIETTARVH